MGDHLPGRPGPSTLQDVIEASPSIGNSPVGESSARSTPDVQELRGESRGRKKNENLPPSRAREVQRAFRARRAAHLAKLEDRINELEKENTDLRALLLLPLPERGVLGSGPTGRGKSLKEGGVPMSERVKAKRERDRKRAEEAAKARGEELPREPSPDDDTRSKGARAASASASATGKKRKHSGVDDEHRNEDHLRDGRHVSEPFTATPSSSSVSLRSPSITLPTPISVASGLPHGQQKQSARLPSFSSAVADMGASASTSGTSYTSHIQLPTLDNLSATYGISGTQTPVSPLHHSPLDTTSTGLISAALEGGFPNELHQPFPHGNSQHSNFGNFGSSTSSPAHDPTAALLTRLLSSLPGGAGIGTNNGLNFSNHNNDTHNQNNNNNHNNGLPPLPELLSIIMKNPELQRRILQHQMAQKAQQNQMANQQPQSFPSSSTTFPSSSLFGFESFDSRSSAMQDSMGGLSASGDNGINLARMDPSALFNDLFNNGRNLQGNGSHASAPEVINSDFLSGIMNTIDSQDSQFPSAPTNSNDRPSSSGAAGNIPNYDRLFNNQNQGVMDPSSGLDRPHLGNTMRKDPSTQLPPHFKNIFQSPNGPSHIARPSSVPLPHNRTASERPVHSSRMNPSGQMTDQPSQPASIDLKGKGKQAEVPQTRPSSSNIPVGGPTSSGAKPQPDLLHRLRHCCHLSDVHVTSDPGLLLFASRLCLAVGCEYNGKHSDPDATSAGMDEGNGSDNEPASDHDFLKLEAAWQLLRQHLDPPSPSTNGFPSLPDGSASGDGKGADGKAVDGQNQIATGRLAAEMVLRAVRAKTQAHDGEDAQVAGKGMSRWIACRRTMGMSLDSAMIMALVNGFGGNWNSMHD
ncbi:hypothetical protein NliqN6_1992 [Naganishia liquefaciens]|uniref:BZIP domain-containing protein n=1 Tax=Naganishia liquefaciens TaxID=104408 RepID=A0A8H3TS28_9TREE|nr:hypothetical protein NliqN6_1992 [Naganishia liquefaciens]